MKTNKEKMDEELLIIIYKLWKRIKENRNRSKKNGEQLEIGLDSNQHLFKKLNDEVKKKEKMIIAKYKEQ